MLSLTNLEVVRFYMEMKLHKRIYYARLWLLILGLVCAYLLGFYFNGLSQL
jgi:hypothetical protein